MAISCSSSESILSSLRSKPEKAASSSPYPHTEDHASNAGVIDIRMRGEPLACTLDGPDCFSVPTDQGSRHLRDAREGNVSPQPGSVVRVGGYRRCRKRRSFYLPAARADRQSQGMRGKGRRWHAMSAAESDVASAAHSPCDRTLPPNIVEASEFRAERQDGCAVREGDRRHPLLRCRGLVGGSRIRVLAEPKESNRLQLTTSRRRFP